MELTYSNIFLGVWATIATILAVMFRHEAIGAHSMLVKTMFAFKDIAEGKAKVTLVDNTMKIIRLDEEK